MTKSDFKTPMTFVAFAVCGGILADRFWDIPFAVWVLTFALTLVLAAAVFRFNGRMPWSLKDRALAISISKYSASWYSTLLLLFACVTLGGIWHHLRWNWFAENELSLFASESFEPVSIRAKVVEVPRRLPAVELSPLSSFPVGERWKVAIQAIEIRDGEHWMPANGNAKLLIVGQCPELLPGHQIEVVGRLARSCKPSNPGEFDFYAYNRGQASLCLVSVGSPQAIKILNPERSLRLRFGRYALRRRFHQALADNISPDQLPFASAILLGDRSSLPDERERAFFLTGTIHVLAISGLHVGILAAGILFLGKLEWWPRSITYWMTILLVVSYAWLVEFRPPVLRAAVLVSIFCLGRLQGREGFSVNTLAIAAILVLAFNPYNLFSAGTQLSFLAVGALCLSKNWLAKHESTDSLQRLILQTRPYPIRQAIRFRETAFQAFKVSLVIWLAAMPLVAFRFHLIAPIGIVLNPAMMIPLAFGLFSGFATMILGGFFSPVGAIAGMGCESTLEFLECLIEFGRQVPGGHFWHSGPSQVSVIIFYITFAILLGLRPFRLTAKRLAAIYLSWIAFAWLLPNWIQSQSPNEQTVVTFIDVAHGTSVLIELPNGQNCLYDCGSLGVPERGGDKIISVLRDKKVSHLDAVLISHADLDHFNCLPYLATQISIGVVYISDSMKRSQDPAAIECIRQLTSRGIEIRQLHFGDQLNCGSAQLKVIGPQAGLAHGSDNSQSLIVSIESFQRRILLPGDVEGPGLESLLEKESVRQDVLMAPHHGSVHSHPTRFMTWARPRVVVVSGRERRVSSREWSRFDVPLFKTEIEGAIEVRLSPEGPIRITTHRTSRIHDIE